MIPARSLEQRIRLRLLMEDPSVVHDREAGAVWLRERPGGDVRAEFAARVAALEAQDSVEAVMDDIHNCGRLREALEALQ